MGLESTPLFSIIICAQDRRKYLLAAIKSAVAQTVPRETFEVIVVKNFSDDEIDSFAEKNQVQTVLVDSGPLSSKIAEGSERSKGRYLCFLDDDDLFAPDKLSRIQGYITKYGEISYYHNSFITIDEDGAEIGAAISIQAESPKVFNGTKEILDGIPYMIRFRADWYASTICVRRNLVADHIRALRQTTASTDKFLFLAGISEGGLCILDNERTTLYRMHKSLTTVVSHYEDFIDRKKKFYEKSMKSFRVIADLFRLTPISGVCESYLTHDEVLSAFVGDQDTFPAVDGLQRVLRSSFHHGFKSTLVWYFLLLLRKLFGSIVLRSYYAWSNTRFATLTGSSAR